MKKIKTLSVQVGDILCYEVPKRGGATIKRGATIRGNMVYGIWLWKVAVNKKRSHCITITRNRNGANSNDSYPNVTFTLEALLVPKVVGTRGRWP